MVGASDIKWTLRRQRIAFAQFTARSLNERDIASLMLDACLRARAGMDTTHARNMEYLPDGDRLILRAGAAERTGWRLWVADHRRGSPPDHADAPGRSSGRQLLATLAARLDAEIRSVSDGGTRVEVSSGLTG
jgi:two-component sensor histidine kinase